jgi:hypothetical protein
VTDADAILAAAFASSGDPRKMLALSVYGVLATTDMRGARAVARDMARTLVGFGWKGKLPRISMIEAYDLAMNLLKLWHKRTCPECSGRGHPLMPEAPVMDLSVDCPRCDGEGIIPLNRIFKPNQVPHARWLENEINTLNSMVFSEMAKWLSTQMI